jgi:metal-responsive CopG/Arc/MetJ family transcriptional regulator
MPRTPYAGSELVSVRVRPLQLIALDRVCADEGLTRSEVIRNLIAGLITNRDRAQLAKAQEGSEDATGK